MFDAAKLFVQAWREMLAMESALTHAIRLRHYSVFGDRLRSFDVELIGRTNPGDLLPNLIEGISYDELSDLNHAFRKYDEATSQQVNQRLQAAGIPNGWHTVYHPGANDDIWMGGPLPLGYDVKNRLLVVNEAEAAVVRRIFDDFVTVRSTTAMARNYATEGLVSKTGKPLTKQTLYKLLHNRMYLGEINHKGQSYPGEHQAIITQAQWDAVQALIDYYAPEVRRQRRGRPEPLLGGLLFTADGEKFTATYTEKNGRRYGYYTPSAQRRMGAWAKKHGALPIDVVEALVTEQIVAALQVPHIVQAVVDRLAVTRPDLEEPKVVLMLKMQQLAEVWKALFPVERHRLAQLLIERVVMGADGMEIVWRDIGWQELAAELLPGTIGAELQELEETA